MNKGKIVTLSGMSGVGKSFFIKQLLSRIDCFEKLKAVTTRNIRKDEVNGVDKYFISLDEFIHEDSNSEMCAVNEVFRNMYGSYKKDIEKILNGTNLITELYYSEVPDFKKQYPDTISIYIVPGDVALAIKNLEARNIEGDEFEKRIHDIKNELEFFSKMDIDCFDYILVNDYNLYSVDEFNDYISKTLGIELHDSISSNGFIDRIPQHIKSMVDDFALKDKSKKVVYTSFDGDDMHYLHDICKTVIEQGKIPLNPESALGYYVSTVMLGGVKQKVMTDCLTLELMADELYVYRNDNVDISEGIIAEMMLWNIIKKNGFSFIHDVRNLDKAYMESLDYDQLTEWVKSQDSVLKQELFHNLLDEYVSQNHKRAYIVANFKNFKHIDWARAYCYENGVCPISPQNILPFSKYRNLKKDYLEARLELLSRVDEVYLFMDRFNQTEELEKLDEFSLAELYYLEKYCKKPFSIIGWDQAKVPKYDKGKKWSLTTKEDIRTRKLVK